MKKVSLFNKKGIKLIDVNIKESEVKPDGIQWGCKLYLWNSVMGSYIEGEIVPAIISKSKK